MRKTGYSGQGYGPYNGKEQGPFNGNGEARCLSENVREAMEQYFVDLEGHEPDNLYDLFLSQFERPLFEQVMYHTDGNISRAAQLLGMNRGTLRNRLKKYDLG